MVWYALRYREWLAGRSLTLPVFRARVRGRDTQLLPSWFWGGGGGGCCCALPIDLTVPPCSCLLCWPGCGWASGRGAMQDRGQRGDVRRGAERVALVSSCALGMSRCHTRDTRGGSGYGTHRCSSCTTHLRTTGRMPPRKATALPLISILRCEPPISGGHSPSAWLPGPQECAILPWRPFLGPRASDSGPTTPWTTSDCYKTLGVALPPPPPQHKKFWGRWTWSTRTRAPAAVLH